MGDEVPAVADQGALFRRLRVTLLRNGLRVALENGRVRLFTMIATSGVVAAFAFAVSLYLFGQLKVNNIPFKGAIVEALFDILFFTLGTMLVFSTGIILYASLFTSPEARFLLCSPARADHIFATKFQAALTFSSWGIVILGVPIFVARCCRCSCSGTSCSRGRCRPPGASCSCGTCRGTASSSSPSSGWRSRRCCSSGGTARRWGSASRW